ncbi:MAG TPA: hypothetical protein QGH10_21350, partial [Armatimonadota bacterium]|nr:hypothetical protein [Armatimonadota bacterium]
MRIVVCPQCGHQNRSAIVATICDSCGDDISTVAAANEVADRFEAEPDDPVLTPATAPVEDVAPEPEPEDDPAPPEKIAWIAVRLVLSAAVIYGSITLSLKVPLGSALAGDPLLAGSVAILGGAAAVSGLVLLLVGTGHKSGGVTLSLRGLGVLLAFIGIWAVAA